MTLVSGNVGFMRIFAGVFGGVCRKNSRDWSSGVARLLKVGDKDADAYETPKASSGGMPLAWRRWGMGRGSTQPTRRSGERRKLLQGAVNEFGALWSCQKATGGNHFEYSAAHVLH